MLADRVRSPKGVTKDRPRSCEHPLGHLERLLLVGQVLADDEELVTAEAPDGVGGAHALGESLGDGGEDEVTGFVAQLVVHELEVVDVDEQHGHDGLPAPHAGQGVGEPVADEHPVSRSRERVVDDLVRQLGARARSAS